MRSLDRCGRACWRCPVHELSDRTRQLSPTSRSSGKWWIINASAQTVRANLETRAIRRERIGAHRPCERADEIRAASPRFSAERVETFMFAGVEHQFKHPIGRSKLRRRQILWPAVCLSIRSDCRFP